MPYWCKICTVISFRYVVSIRLRKLHPGRYSALVLCVSPKCAASVDWVLEVCSEGPLGNEPDKPGGPLWREAGVSCWMLDVLSMLQVTMRSHPFNS